MARRSRSSVNKLDPRIREAVEAAIRDGRASTDELVALIRSCGAEVSRSAVGRYAKSYEESLVGYREAQEAAERWIKQFRENEDSDLSRLLTEMIKVAAFRSLGKRGEAEGEEADPLELSRMARMVRDLASVDRIKAEAEKRARQDIQAKAAPALEQAEAEARQGRISPEAIRRIREEIYGVRE